MTVLLITTPRRWLMGRKAGLFLGSDRSGQRVAFFDSLIVSAKLDDVDPHEAFRAPRTPSG